MKKSCLSKIIIKDAFNILKICIFLYFLEALSAILLPSINAYLIGNITDLLLNLDTQGIKQEGLKFIISLILSVILFPLFSMLKYNTALKKMMDYENFITDKFIKSDLLYIKSKNFGELIERLTGTLGDFCWVIIMVSGIPLVIVFYAAFIIYMICRNDTNWIFMLIVFLILKS